MSTAVRSSAPPACSSSAPVLPPGAAQASSTRSPAAGSSSSAASCALRILHRDAPGIEAGQLRHRHRTLERHRGRHQRHGVRREAGLRELVADTRRRWYACGRRAASAAGARCWPRVSPRDPPARPRAIASVSQAGCAAAAAGSASTCSQQRLALAQVTAQHRIHQARGARLAQQARRIHRLRIPWPRADCASARAGARRTPAAPAAPARSRRQRWRAAAAAPAAAAGNGAACQASPRGSPRAARRSRRPAHRRPSGRPASPPRPRAPQPPALRRPRRPARSAAPCARPAACASPELLPGHRARVGEIARADDAAARALQLLDRQHPRARGHVQAAVDQSQHRSRRRVHAPPCRAASRARCAAAHRRGASRPRARD